MKIKFQVEKVEERAEEEDDVRRKSRQFRIWQSYAPTHLIPESGLFNVFGGFCTVFGEIEVKLSDKIDFPNLHLLGYITTLNIL